jgi:hypothetical protein
MENKLAEGSLLKDIVSIAHFDTARRAIPVEMTWNTICTGDTQNLSRMTLRAHSGEISSGDQRRKQSPERAAREQQIRKEAAEARLRAAADEAAAKADKAVAEKKFSADEAAAATTKTIAEQDTTKAAAVAKDIAKKAQEKIEARLNEAGKATTKAKSEVVDAEKEVAAATTLFPKEPGPESFDRLELSYQVGQRYPQSMSPFQRPGRSPSDSTEEDCRSDSTIIAPSNPRISATQFEDPEVLDPKYKIQNERTFWVLGRVFAMMFPETRVEKRNQLDTDSDDSRFGIIGRGEEVTFAHIKSFVVIRKRAGYCFCVSINS